MGRGGGAHATRGLLSEMMTAQAVAVMYSPPNPWREGIWRELRM